MDVRVKFLGAAQSVTGSKFLIETSDKNILVDCGLFQGASDIKARNWDTLPFDASKIDAVVLTHAHLDHCGYLPKLFKDGYDGHVYCTKPTAELAELIMMDSAKLMEEDAEYAKKKGYSRHKNPRALYTSEDVEEILPAICGYFYEQTIAISERISVRFQNAGHILGAAIVELFIQGDTQEKKLVFSGDLGRDYDQILHPPTIIKEADILFVESTYGDRKNPFHINETIIDEVVNETFQQGGCVLIPAFAVGRTQNIMLYLKDLMQAGRIPETSVYMDSPMAIEATKIYGQNFDFHKIEWDDIHSDHSFLSLNKNLHVVRRHDDSISLNNIEKNAIIISSSGMMTGGRILHHLYNRLPRPNDTLLLVGFQAEGTRGRLILDGEETVSIFGQQVPVKCRVEFIDGLSAHADQTELLNWISGIKKAPKMTFLVHGEKNSSEYLKGLVERELGWNTFVPNYLESFELFRGI